MSEHNPSSAEHKVTSQPALNPALWPASLVSSIGALVVILFVFMSMELPLYVHSPSIRWWQLIIVVVSPILVIAIWVATEIRSSRYLERSLDSPRRWFLHQLKRLPLLAAMVVAATFGIRHVAFAALGISYGAEIGLFAFETLKFGLLYCCWLALMFGVLSFAHMRQQAEHLLNVQKTLAEAKLSQLKAQLRPHFLFNTLNTISALMQVDVARADRLLTLLGDLLRANLNASDRDVVPLGEELALLRQYADIMQERFIDRVTISWDIVEGASSVPVPTMLLQPLLENAFKHGVERDSAAQVIRLRAYRREESLCISIHNSGSIVNEPQHDGWGLRSCRERLQLLYGAQASLRLANNAQGGVEAIVSLPWSSGT